MTIKRQLKSPEMLVSNISEDMLPEIAVILEKLQRIRIQKGLTQSDIARRCGTSTQTINRLLSGSMGMNLVWLILICRAIKIDPAILFINENAPGNSLTATISEIIENLNKLSEHINGLEISMRDAIAKVLLDQIRETENA